MRFRKLKKQSKINSTNNQDTPKIKYAKITDKIKAFITDMFMIYAPILYIITYVVMGGKDEFQESQIAPLIGVSLYALIYAVLLSKSGQTPGKKAYTIKVVDEIKQTNISFVRALCRFIIFLLGATVLVGLIVPFYRKDNKGLHDILCKTVEIEIE